MKGKQRSRTGRGIEGGEKVTKSGYEKTCFIMPSGWGPKPENGSRRKGIIKDDFDPMDEWKEKMQSK